MLMAVLARLAPDGVPRQSDILAVIGRFPVAGLAWWQDDWHAYRCCPYPHLHQGLDLFAPRGTPVVASADGVVTLKAYGAVSGMAVEIRDLAGTEYFYAHLSGFASGIQAGTRVREGQVLGYVGDTGNARGTSPHLHFEVQPGGVPVPPMPYVNRWVASAEQRAILLLEERFPFAITDLDLAVWLERASALAGEARGEHDVLEGAGSAPPVPEGAPGQAPAPPGQAPPGLPAFRPLATSAAVRVGAASLALVLLVVVPGVAWGQPPRPGAGGRRPARTRRLVPRTAWLTWMALGAATMGGVLLLALR
jgi:hypothetical protein